MTSTTRAAPRSDLRVDALRSQLPDGVPVMGPEPVRLSWMLSSEGPEISQDGFEIETAETPGFEETIATTGVVALARQMGVAPGAPLRSREVRYYRVRVWVGDTRSEWSEPLRVEAGLLEPGDWGAQAITLPSDPGRARQAPTPFLRREFDLDGAPIRARLYVTSLGVHEVRINGHRVGTNLLSPGWTSYRHRLLADTHDVTDLLAEGPNVIGATLGDGWYRGRLGWDAGGRDRCRYGEELGLILRLEVELPDGRVATVVSDGSWQASTAEILAADLYDGMVVDLRERQTGWDRAGFDASMWRPAAVVPLDARIIQPRMSEPVRVIETRPVELVRRPDGAIHLDSGQNLAGFVRLRVQGVPGDRVTVRHAEVLEPDGSLHTRSLRTARATDVYTLADADETVLDPAFTFHGFRFAEVITTARVLGAEVVAISSDLAPRGTFACSDDRLNKLHENVRWSQRGNFVSIPTDCPQRDERLGWTGDAQAFASTASTLFESDAFWQNWLRDLELDQDDKLGVPSVVPDVVLGGEARYGRAGWADAATIVPWAVYQSYGDPEILRRQFASMQRWVDSLVRRQGPDGLLLPSWQFGDWLDPDAPPDRPWEAKADGELIANAFFARSSQILADVSAVLGEPEAAREYGAVAARVAAATWSRWSEEAQRTQTGCAIALEFGIAPASDRAAVVEALAKMVNDADGRVATGFLGTPLVLPALAEAGRFDEAYKMLLRSDAPSWLYQVQQGATTVWERWDAIRPDGSIHPGIIAPVPDAPEDAEAGSMLSFNHYAYGAVIDWVYRHVAGLAPDAEGPGYAKVVFGPRPAAGIEWARASLESPFGKVAIEWRVEWNRLTAEVDLPVGASGTFLPPATDGSEVWVDDQQVPAGSKIELGPGHHRLAVTRPAVADLAH